MQLENIVENGGEVEPLESSATICRSVNFLAIQSLFLFCTLIYNVNKASFIFCTIFWILPV